MIGSCNKMNPIFVMIHMHIDVPLLCMFFVSFKKKCDF